MILRDALNNEIKEGDVVSLAVGNELGAGTVVKTSAGLALQGGQPMPPMILIQVVINKPALENGIIPGVLKVTVPEGKKLIEA